MNNCMIKEMIENKLKSIPNHVLNHVNEDYKKELFDILNEVNEKGFFKNNKNLDSIIDRLQLSNFNLNQYYQSISEIIFEIFSVKSERNFTTNKKVRSDRNTDIDIEIIKNDYKFNFEIKTPVIQVCFAMKKYIVLQLQLHNVAT